MVNQPSVGPVALYEAATARALSVVEAVDQSQLGLATPCRAWSVQDLVDHLVAGTDYLLAAMAGRVPEPVHGADPSEYGGRVARVLEGLTEPGALERLCISPLGFEWPVEQAVAGTFMDVLIHTWDLATATGQDTTLDPVLVDACVAMFLPDMPERGRAAGIVGEAVAVGADASAQDRLLGAMGRQP